MQDADSQIGSAPTVRWRTEKDYFMILNTLIYSIVFYTLMFIGVILCETACKFNLDLNYIVFTEKTWNTVVTTNCVYNCNGVLLVFGNKNGVFL